MRADHKLVSSLFAEYEKARAPSKKKQLVAEICTELSVHAQVEEIDPDGEMFDAKIKVLSEYVKHPVKEEHTEMFPKAKATKLDMLELGGRIAERKKLLLAARTWAGETGSAQRLALRRWCCSGFSGACFQRVPEQVFDLRVRTAQLGRRETLDLGPELRVDAQQERLLVGAGHRRARLRSASNARQL